MKIIIFDLGDTLEHTVQGKDILMSGAKELLSEIQNMHDHNGDSPALALVSDLINQPKSIMRFYRLLV